MAVAKSKAAAGKAKPKAKAKKAVPAAAPAKKKAAAKAPLKTVAKAPAKKPAAAAPAPAPAPAKKKPAVARGATHAASQLFYLGLEPYQEKKGEQYMGPKQVAHFRVILNTWKNKLIDEMERTVVHMRDEAANFPDPNDRASQESDFALELRTRDRERKLIKKIDESLRSLENNEYGFCEVCGVEIGIRRLEARPTANLCIDCKTLDEIRERQVKG
ncbi:MAG: RNA polymerase-binding protein DksA [Gammaproteobacteria bacterium]|nr:RNA polymerase-binding protein DksA [Gammaproteobacteria bacterium]